MTMAFLLETLRICNWWYHRLHMINFRCVVHDNGSEHNNIDIPWCLPTSLQQIPVSVKTSSLHFVFAPEGTRVSLSFQYFFRRFSGISISAYFFISNGPAHEFWCNWEDDVAVPNLRISLLIFTHSWRLWWRFWTCTFWQVRNELKISEWMNEWIIRLHIDTSASHFAMSLNLKRKKNPHRRPAGNQKRLPLTFSSSPSQSKLRLHVASMDSIIFRRFKTWAPQLDPEVCLEPNWSNNAATRELLCDIDTQQFAFRKVECRPARCDLGGVVPVS